MTKQDLEELKLSESLITQIRNLIDGNQISGDELKELGHEIYEIQLNLILVWTFSAHYYDIEDAGGRPAQVHFGKSSAKFEEHTSELEKLAKTDKKIRANFLGKFVEAKHKGLLSCVGEVSIDSFERFSYRYDCSYCNGKGYESCYSCSNGKVSCSYCSGNGKTERYQDEYNYKGEYVGRRVVYDTCYHCGGSGKTTCSNCGGTGRKRCDFCRETGFFTKYRNMSVIATPSFNIKVISDAYGNYLEKFLNAMSLQFSVQKALFEFISHKSISTDKEQFSYKAQSFITELDFELLNKKHLCLGFSNPPFAFIRPFIFDDIFADELALIDKINKDGKVSAGETWRFFSKYQGQPVLDKSLMDIAKMRKNANDDTSMVVSNACQNFISDEVASTISTFLSKCIDKISPAYSKFTWILGALFFCILAFIGIEITFEQQFNKSMFKIIFISALTAIILWVMWALILWCISSIIILIKRRKIPKEYRQKMRNKEAYRIASFFVLVTCILGAVYGGLANKNIAFKFEKHFNYAKEKICEVSKAHEWNKKYQFVSKICPAKKPQKRRSKNKR